MNDEERAMLERQQVELDLEQQRVNQNSPQYDLQSLQLREQQRSWVDDQINLGKEIELIEHLLKGEILKKDTEGNKDWQPPKNTEQIVLSEHGVHLIINTISFYLNKNTLLSNYDEETIQQKMEDFGISLADTIFMEYEKVFLYPSFEECKKVFEERIERKVQLRKFAYELMGKENINEEAIKESFIHEIEDRIESEIGKIREQIMKNKLKRFDLLIREVQDAVHSTYLRALYGAERRTIRQHSHFNETAGMNQQPPKQKSSLNPLGYFRRR